MRLRKTLARKGVDAGANDHRSWRRPLIRCRRSRLSGGSWPAAALSPRSRRNDRLLVEDVYGDQPN